MVKCLFIVGTVVIVLVFVYLKFFNVPIIYKGETPCADCPGIDVTLTLNPNGTYTNTYVYRERDTSNTDKGKWDIIKGTKTDPNAKVYKLTNEDGNNSYYVLEGNQVRSLDADLNEIPAPYNGPLTRQ